VVSVDVSWFGAGIVAQSGSASPWFLWVRCNFAAGVYVLSELSDDARQRIFQRTLRAVGGANLGRPYCKNVNGTTAKLFNDAVSVTGCKRRMAELNWKESQPVGKHCRSLLQTGPSG